MNLKKAKQGAWEGLEEENEEGNDATIFSSQKIKIISRK